MSKLAGAVIRLLERLPVLAVHGSVTNLRFAARYGPNSSLGTPFWGCWRFTTEGF